jgi:hypothetical protein
MRLAWTQHGPCKGAKRKNCKNTAAGVPSGSHVIPQRRTGEAQPNLTSVIGREPVCCGWYDRSMPKPACCKLYMHIAQHLTCLILPCHGAASGQQAPFQHTVQGTCASLDSIRHSGQVGGRAGCAPGQCRSRCRCRSASGWRARAGSSAWSGSPSRGRLARRRRRPAPARMRRLTQGRFAASAYPVKRPKPRPTGAAARASCACRRGAAPHAGQPPALLQADLSLVPGAAAAWCSARRGRCRAAQPAACSRAVLRSMRRGGPAGVLCLGVSGSEVVSCVAPGLEVRAGL